MMLGMMLHSGKDAYNICKAMGSTPNTMKKREKKAPDVMGSQMGYPEKDCWHPHNFAVRNSNFHLITTKIPNPKEVYY